MWISLFFYVPYICFKIPHQKEGGTEDMMDKLDFQITRIGEGRISVEIYFKVGELVKELLGILYFEKAKRTYNRKPIGMDQWACVDAKVEGLYTKDGGITPKQIVAHAYELVKKFNEQNP